MHVTKLVPFITTRKLEESKAFFTRNLGFTVQFDGPMYLGLRSADGGTEIAFMSPDSDAQPTYSGAGLTYGLEVADVDGEYGRLREKGIAIEAPPRDNPWGDRSFMLRDPNGITLYVYKPTAMSKEYQQYAKA